MDYNIKNHKSQEFLEIPPPPEVSASEKRDFAINKRVPFNVDILNRLNKIEPLYYQFNDKGNGRLFADVFKDILRFNATAKSWYYFNGRAWEIDLQGLTASRLAKELTDALLRYCITIHDDEKKQIYIKYVGGLCSSDKLNIQYFYGEGISINIRHFSLIY